MAFVRFLVMNLSTNRVPIISAIPTGRAMYQLCTKPAMIKLTNDTPATVIAYGSWVDTWLMWLH